MSELTVGSLSGLSANNFVIDVASGSKIVQPGAVLQVVSTAKTDTFTTASTTYVDVTGLTATITPSSTSSKIMVFASVIWGASSTNELTFITVADGSNNNLIVPSSPGSREPGFIGQIPAGNQTVGAEVASFSLLHSPATTSAFTYKIRAKGTAGSTALINRSSGDENAVSRLRGVSTITLMEIAG
jgi:hypothetical protein